jgi:uncharacterized protein (DUF58 family)
MFKICFKKLGFLLFVIAFSLFMGMKNALGFFLFISYFVSAALVISLAWTILEYFLVKVSLSRSVVGQVDELDTLEISLVIRNKSFFPAFNLLIQDNLTCAAGPERLKKVQIDYLLAQEEEKINYSCFCYKRGRYILGAIAVYFFDPFGIFFIKKTYPVYSEVYVYPRTFKIRDFPELIKGVVPWFGINSSRSSGDEDEFFAIREYKSGDPINRIHWISTARKNKLIIKQFQPQSFFRATIIFNLRKTDNFGEGRESVSEYIIRLVASVAKYLLDKNVSVEIIAEAQEAVHIPFNRGQVHLEGILKFLASASAESSVSLGEMFEDAARHIPRDSNLIVIMLDKEWNNLPTMIPMEKRNVSLLPLILVSSTFLYSIENQEVVKDVRMKVAKAYNISPILISRGDNLEEIFLKGIK